MAQSSWLIGSYPNFPAQSFTVNAAPTGNETKSIASTDLYLYHTTAALSLMKQLELQIEDHTDITSATVEFLQNRKIKISADASFTIVWGSATTLRDMLGFTGDCSPTATSHIADVVSGYLWSPGKAEIAVNTPLGATGARATDTAIAQSGTDVFCSTKHNDSRIVSWRWRNCANARVWTSSEAGGEHEVFWYNVLSQYRRFFHWRLVTEDDASESAATLSTVIGPYKMEPSGNRLVYPYARESNYGFVDARHPIELDAVMVSEYA